MRISTRRLRFMLIERLLLPPAALLLRLLVRTWRVHGPNDAQIAELAREPRLVVATYHGMLLHLIPFAGLAAQHGRRFVVMLSPSLDGRLLAAALQRFGVDHVHATSNSRAVAGTLEFIRRIHAGDVGIVAVDGPRGPGCIAKPGVVRLAGEADSPLLLAVTSASWGLRFGSWDRAHLPLPFARVELSLRLLPPPPAGVLEEHAAAIQKALLETAQRMRSPVLPPALRYWCLQKE